MDTIIKAKWLAALRSDEFTQGKGYLVVPENADLARAVGSAPGSRCCLGVLATIMSGIDLLAGGAYLPHREANAIGIGPGVQEKLSRMNDTDGANLLEIADWIEANL